MKFRSRKFEELRRKIEKLCEELVETKKENARLARLLKVAEDNLKRPSGGNGNSSDASIVEMTSQLEKLKNERKLIKGKVEKMAARLDLFYND